MTITFEAVQLPFKVGDTVYVNQEHDQRSDDKSMPAQPYFEGQIERIFFDGSLEEISVITEPLDTYELQVSTAIYVVKPTGKFTDLLTVPVKLNLPIKEPKLFATEKELTDYRHDRGQLKDTLNRNGSN